MKRESHKWAWIFWDIWTEFQEQIDSGWKVFCINRYIHQKLTPNFENHPRWKQHCLPNPHGCVPCYFSGVYSIFGPSCGKFSLDMDTQISPYWKWNTWSEQSLFQHPCGNFQGCMYPSHLFGWVETMFVHSTCDVCWCVKVKWNKSPPSC